MGSSRWRVPRTVPLGSLLEGRDTHSRMGLLRVGRWTDSGEHDARQRTDEPHRLWCSGNGGRLRSCLDCKSLYAEDETGIRRKHIQML